MATDPSEPAPLPGPAFRAAVLNLIHVAGERDHAERTTEENFRSRQALLEQEYDRKKHAILDRATSRTAEETRADEERRRAITAAAIDGEAKAKNDFAKNSRAIAAEFEQKRSAAQAAFQQTRWEATTIFEAGDKNARQRHLDDSAHLKQVADLLLGMCESADAFHDRCREFGVASFAAGPDVEDFQKHKDPITILYERLTQINDSDLAFFTNLAIPRAMSGGGGLWLAGFIAVLGALAAGFALGWSTGAPAGAVAGLALGLLLRHWLRSLARKQVDSAYLPLKQKLANAEALAGYCHKWIEDNLQAATLELKSKRDREFQAAKERLDRAILEAESLRDEKLRALNEAYLKLRTDIQTTQQREMKLAVEQHDHAIRDIESERASALDQLERKYQAAKSALQEKYQSAWNALEAAWHAGLHQSQSLIQNASAQINAYAPPWDSTHWNQPPLQTRTPPALPFGQIHLQLADLPGGWPRDPRLQANIPAAFHFPAVYDFPDRANLLIESRGPEGHAATLDVLQNAMLRLMTSLPPGKVRFTIIDPLGLGRSFAAFMHLADFDESLVTHRIWTEPDQIERQLAALSEHMEKVLQKYLRNEYATIEEYNAKAGELAEPFRVLVVADFPVHFDERAARRLQNILASGRRCGVLALVGVDLDRELPPNITLDALRPLATRLVWENGRLLWKDPDLGPYPLELEKPPGADQATRLLHLMGDAARRASRVEVPFEFIAPPESDFWKGDSRAGIEIALGKSGATRRQYLSLGRGTSQHVVIAGRTGSGKSSLLHALITNLASVYDPDQVELYLIDFKKGVEFKTYATHALPHARVVAIESEREFGISVLQRLDAVLKERAEEFRKVGVQDLPAYRDAPGTTPMPRILLIVDEFQEFFVEDDRVAQEASLLLDRLVRQGRAFGVHVILGSQTLGGAYALARSTIGQMAVRIALQCTEADAHMILSEDNAAASLLSRPGEAVYNDSNGMVEGNQFFQVAWLGDERRDRALQQIERIAAERLAGLARKPLVFEGNVAARIEENPAITRLLEPADWSLPSPRAAHGWLGDAVAIKEPTAAVFRRQGGRNLLVIGPNEEAALGVVAGLLVGLAAQLPPVRGRAGRFYLLDATPEGTPHHGALARVAQALPHQVRYGEPRDAARLIAEVAAELELRQAPDARESPDLFLLIHDIARFRNLRKKEDDFSFSRREEPASPGDLLAAILREGPALGIFTIAWCDSLNNLNRTFDRAALRELEQRVLFQMSAGDSSHLIDSPAASRLGPNRAYLSDEEEGKLEKFRPFAPPDPAWLDQLHRSLARRTAAIVLDHPSDDAARSSGETAEIPAKQTDLF
jgi:ABC-type multidrug transport system fused ATPase/permease subunit